MKKSTKLLYSFVGGVLLFAALPLRSAHAGPSVTFNDNKQVVCSTSAATLLSNACLLCMRTTIINGNTDYVLIGDSSGYSFSTSASTGTARITNASYSPDGSINPYGGALYCLGSGSAGVTVQILRLK